MTQSFDETAKTEERLGPVKTILRVGTCADFVHEEFKDYTYTVD